MFEGRQTGSAAEKNGIELKRIQDALRSSEAEFRTLVETMPQIVWVTRPDGWHIDFNQYWLDYTGLTLEESLGFGWNPPFHPEDRGRAAERWLQATGSGEPYEIEYRLRRWDGVYHWMLGRAVPMRNIEGNIVKWFGTCTDIDDLKRTQERLDEAQSVGKIGDWEYNLITEETTWSPVLYKLLGRDSRLGPPQTLQDSLMLYDAESAVLLNKKLSLGATSLKTQKFDLRTKGGDGHKSYVQIVAVPRTDDSGNVVSLFGTIQDISERKLAELALKESQDLLERTNQVARVGGWETDLSTGELWWTSVTRDILEVDRTEPAPPLNEALPNFYRGEYLELVSRNLAHARDHGVAVDFDTQLHTRTGRIKWVRIQAQPEVQNGKTVRLLGTYQDITERKALENQLEYQAFHDPLTGLPNRRRFTDRLEQTVAHGRHSGKTFAVLLLDLNDFKALNDGFGHEIGDQALTALGSRVQGLLKEGDMVARWGGDELVLLCRDLEDPSVISPLVEWVLDALEAPFVIGSQEFRLTATIGIAVDDASEQSASSLIMQADGAMYWAKKAGQRFAFYAKEVGEAARERLYLGTELARALEKNQLGIHYQPQVDLRSGQCLGLEALIRWYHPDEGWIPPARFIPLVEQTGLIHRLGEWVLERACLQASQWLADGWDFGYLAINIASQQLSSNGLIDQVDRVLNLTGFPSSRLELELTESSLVEPSPSVFNTLEALRNRGICIAIDDFGTGYSSLGYLKDLPVDRLKIDRSFVDGLPEDERSLALVQTVITLGSKLGFQILAEGIETPAQAQALVQEGCFAGQGYLFAKPLDPEAIRTIRFPLQLPYAVA